jgi:hypothetical protein
LIDLESRAPKRVDLEIRKINVVIDDQYSDHGGVLRHGSRSIRLSVVTVP